MQVEILGLKSADATVIEYINEIKAHYEQQIESVIKELTDYQNKYLEIKEQYDLLVYKRFARSAEQLLVDEKQPMLFTEESKKNETTEKTKPEEITEVKSFKRKKGGRKPIDPAIKRERTVIDIPESEKTCACGAVLKKIGEEISERLHIEPPKIYVEQIVRPKYACHSCEGTGDEDGKTVRIAPVEPTIIPKSIASASLLSTIITQKFEMHLPYFRQEKQFKQIGVALSRQDMANWQQQAYKKLEPLFVLLEEEVKSFPVLQMDETRVQVVERTKRKDTQGYMWLARGGPPDKKVIWYEYHESRAGKHAKDFLEGYRGYLQTDGYQGGLYPVRYTQLSDFT
jgi:transposase